MCPPSVGIFGTTAIPICSTIFLSFCQSRATSAWFRVGDVESQLSAGVDQVHTASPPALKYAPHLQAGEYPPGTRNSSSCLATPAMHVRCQSTKQTEIDTAWSAPRIIPWILDLSLVPSCLS